MTRFWTAIKDVASCDKPWRAACKLWTRDFWMWLHFLFVERSLGIANAGNWNILVPAGKETNWDAVSKSDWKRHRANRMFNSNIRRMWC